MGTIHCRFDRNLAIWLTISHIHTKDGYLYIHPLFRADRSRDIWNQYSYGPLTRYVKLRVAHAPGMPGTFSRHQLQTKPLVMDPGMHHGTCVTHVPWCMSGSITSGGGENVPGTPGACATRDFAYLVRGPWWRYGMETLFILQPLCVVNQQVSPMDSHHKVIVMRDFDISSLACWPNSHHYILTQWRPCDVTVMYLTHQYMVKILPLGRQMKHMNFEKITIRSFLSSNIIIKAAFLKLTDRCQIGFVLKYHYVVILRCVALFCWQYLVKDFWCFLAKCLWHKHVRVFRRFALLWLKHRNFGVRVLHWSAYIIRGLFQHRTFLSNGSETQISLIFCWWYLFQMPHRFELHYVSIWNMVATANK